MSTEVKTNLRNHSVVTFWGGNERGVCVQITAKNRASEEAFVRLDILDVAELLQVLQQFALQEATRRQALLRDLIKQLQLEQRSVFSEIAELNLSGYGLTGAQVALNLVHAYCPTTDNKQKENSNEATY